MQKLKEQAALVKEALLMGRLEFHKLYIKEKSAIAVARQFGGRKRIFNREKFWARGYAVSTVGFEEEQI